MAIVVGLWVGIDALRWAVIVLAMGAVWVAELLNTSLEAVVNIASPNIQPLARIAKDVAAAAVLAGAATAVVIGLLVLGPPTLAKITGIAASWMPN
jgi:diacylglycerol kinase